MSIDGRRVSPFLLALLAAGAFACGDSGVSPRDAAQDAAAADRGGSVDARDAQLSGSDLGGMDTGVTCSYDPCKGKEGEPLCGPVLDLCSGETVFCGTCNEGQVCNLVTNSCEVPRTSCEALGASCGRVLNSCGAWVECGDCPTGERCDPERRECVPCGEVTCEDMGIECGRAWLGCGPQSELTDCGGCAEGQTCNEDPVTFVGFHVCEPTCTPPSTAEEIKQHCESRGAQCGFISDGCGGRVACGVGAASDCEDPTLKCGVRGVPNRCTPPPRPPECLAAGRECGKIISQCTLAEIDCGNCVNEGEICRADNGRCCVPRRCGEGELQGKCGRALDDGCGGTLECLSCPPEQVCSPGEDGVVRACIDQGECADFTSGAESAACGSFDRGDSTLVSCFCQEEGTTLFCVKDGAPVSAGAQGSCCRDANKCAAEPKGGPCEVENSCIPGRKTSCCTGNLFCAANSTCQDCAGAGFNPGLDGKCKGSCPCGSNLTCTDAGGQQVSGETEGKCVGLLNCAASGATGATNAPCSKDPAGAFPRWTGDPSGQTCPCSGSRRCVNSAKTAEVSGSTTGTCLDALSCAASGASGNEGAKCSTTASTQFPRWAGDPTGQACGCNSGLYCDAGTCKRRKTCDDLGHDGSLNDQCSSSPMFDAGGGNMIACGCDAGLVCIYNGREVASGEIGRCQAQLACGDSGWTGVQDSLCSNGNNSTFPRWAGDTRGQTCRCNSGFTCAKSGAPVSGSTLGTCEQNQSCAASGATGAKDSVCSRSASPAFPRFLSDKSGQTCNCSGGRYCVSGSPPSEVSGPATGTCVDPIQCSGSGWTGTAGSACSRGNASRFPRFAGDSQGRTCDCASGFRCIKDGALVSGSTVGTCFDERSCSELGANGQNNSDCSNGDSPTFARWPGDAAGQTCPCGGGLVCVKGGAVVSGTVSGKCTPTLNCAASGATGAEGSACSAQPSAQFPRWTGDATGQSCPCQSGINCVGGTCCQPKCGSAKCGTVTDACGTISCGTCPGPYDECQSNQCVCIPEEEPCIDQNGNRRTGIVLDRCGKPEDCGGG